MNMIKRLFKEEEGQALTEYGLVIGLIAVVCIGALTAMSGELTRIFGYIKSELVNVKAPTTTGTN